MMTALETYVIELIEGEKKSRIFSGVLHMLSKIFESAIKLRHFVFDHAWIKKSKIQVPVISIGNIVAGGTGKTALLQNLAKQFSLEGKTSILIRGYRSQIEKKNQNLHLQEGSIVDPMTCGDEAYLLWKNIPHLSVFVGKNRTKNASTAFFCGAKIVFLDDGMQYRCLHRDLEIVMLHADDLYGKGFYLPRGYLRDFPKRLKLADYVFINHVKNPNHFDRLSRDVRRWTSSSLIGVKMVPKRVLGEGYERWHHLEGKRVSAFCGLGNPSSFFNTIRELNVDLVETLTLPDHLKPTPTQLSHFVNLSEARGCELVLCSEKDWVKLSKPLNYSLPIAYLKASLEVVSNQKEYDRLLIQIRTLMKKGHYETLD